MKIGSHWDANKRIEKDDIKVGSVLTDVTGSYQVIKIRKINDGSGNYELECREIVFNEETQKDELDELPYYLDSFDLVTMEND